MTPLGIFCRPNWMKRKKPNRKIQLLLFNVKTCQLLIKFFILNLKTMNFIE